ncbi:uncharacterized protein C8R40DRAFT_1067686 [Lentinula edodes]|uniref:uncharacterized protein n=1 Tax=Lentinula edodes TaxID=5353 RepID=UPI001E8CC298|nr:uncharacterized protein C8R40DRAFT_1067686 [Lentinula edodes]KAH7877464.1 hypothetical protein C8R40DRAFT_1067686 [Lentinula edodes]
MPFIEEEPTTTNSQPDIVVANTGVIQGRIKDEPSLSSTQTPDSELHKPASITTLPFDIIEEITLLATGYYDDCVDLPDTLDTHADVPAKFAQVCSRWRSAVFASARAWSTVIIKDTRTPYFRLRKLQASISRARTTPLRVYISLKHGACVKIFEEIMESFSESRLLDLEVRVPGYLFSCLRELPPQSTETTLRRLSLLQLPYADRIPIDDLVGVIIPFTPSFITRDISSPIILRSVPELRELSLRDIAYPRFMLKKIKSTCLTTLALSFPAQLTADDLEPLTHLPNLNELSVSRSHNQHSPRTMSNINYLGSVRHSESPWLSTDIQLLHLKKLRIAHAGVFNVKQIHYPALEILDFDEEHTSQVPALSDFVYRSMLMHCLVSLTIRSCVFTNHLGNAFRLMPVLSTLKLYGTSEVDASELSPMLDRLSMCVSGPPGGPRPALLPMLENLEIRIELLKPGGEWFAPFVRNEPSLHQFVHARWGVVAREAEGVGRLKSFRFQWKFCWLNEVTRVSSPYTQRFQEVRDEGMRLSFEVLRPKVNPESASQRILDDEDDYVLFSF